MSESSGKTNKSARSSIACRIKRSCRVRLSSTSPFDSLNCTRHTLMTGVIGVPGSGRGVLRLHQETDTHTDIPALYEAEGKEWFFENGFECFLTTYHTQEWD